MSEFSNIVTLTTDFSTEDGYVGAMKGKILSICSDAKLVDITHHIEPHNILMASWCILRGTQQFPKGSIHVVVVDPGVGSNRNPLLVKANNQWYVGPDNGVFSEIIKNFKDIEVFKIYNETELWKKHQSFDGLEIFSSAAGYLMSGLELSKIAEPTDKIIMLPNADMNITKDYIEGEIIMFDRFGNGVSNIREGDIQSLKNDQIAITCQNHKFRFVSHYREGTENCPVSLINSDNLLELSVYSGSAKDRFNIKVGDKVKIK